MFAGGCANGPDRSTATPETLRVRVAGFDPTLRKVGVTEAQQLTLQVLDGPESGSSLSLAIAPSQHTAAFVGKTLYIRIPWAQLKEQADSVYLAGELLDIAPIVVRSPEGAVEIPAEVAKKYAKAAIALSGKNEIAGATQISSRPEDWVAPEQAVITAAKVAPDGVQGLFALEVRATGHLDSKVYLNSETDYRDQRNLTIAIGPLVAADLKLRYGAEPEVFFKGKHVVVSGIAERVRIDFAVNGVVTEKYYYQTHVNVSSAHQIQIVP